MIALATGTATALARRRPRRRRHARRDRRHASVSPARYRRHDADVRRSRAAVRRGHRGTLTGARAARPRRRRPLDLVDVQRRRGHAACTSAPPAAASTRAPRSARLDAQRRRRARTCTITGTASRSTIAGQKLTGTLHFESRRWPTARNSSRCSSPSAQLSLADGLAIVDLGGELQISAGGLAGKLTVSTPALVLGPVTLDGAFKLAINTAHDGGRARRRHAPPGRPLPPRRGHRRHAHDRHRRRRSAATSRSSRRRPARRQKRLIARPSAGLTVKFGADDDPQQGQGALLISWPARARHGGLAGQFGGTVDLTALTGGAVTRSSARSRWRSTRPTAPITESFAVNGTDDRRSTCPRARSCAIAGTGVELSVAGQTLSGDFGFERSGTTTMHHRGQRLAQPRRRRQRHRGRRASSLAPRPAPEWARPRSA